ncbi:MAG: hypothetical protein OFPII_04590 [Osedax symbiont Rs1]|nr:MAG: hypothetical protein OFPII_04590 [Osedax symbiont Rs1]
MDTFIEQMLEAYGIIDNIFNSTVKAKFYTLYLPSPSKISDETSDVRTLRQITESLSDWPKT